MLFLRIEDASGVRNVRLEGEPFVIGRGEKADFSLDEEKASREHLCVTPVAGGAIVRDLNSTNGTWLPDRRVEQARIYPGESVRVGDSVILLYQQSTVPSSASGAWKPVLAAVVPALILFGLVQLAVSGAESSRAQEVDAARRRLEIARFSLARLPAERSPHDPEAELAALDEFIEAFPDSSYAEEARTEADRIRPKVARVRQARKDLATLAELRKQDALPFAELYYRYEKLLETCSDLPEVAQPIREEFLALDASHRENLADLVRRVTGKSASLAKKGEYGRAASLLTAFSKRSPAAAASYEQQLTDAETLVGNAALYAYRTIMSKADELVSGEQPAEAADLLRSEAGRFTGTRFQALLLSRAGGLVAGIGGRKATAPDAADDISRRRSFILMAEEAEELAAAGFFLRSADKYAEIVPSVTIAEIRDEFALRERELRSLHTTIEGVKARIRDEGPNFGPVRLGEQRFRVVSMRGDTLTLEFRKGEVTREWGALTPEEELSILRSAKLESESRLLLAVYCFYLSLRTDYEVEVSTLR